MVVFQHRANEYFGELALLHNEPRAASVRVVSSKIKVCSVGRDSFKRLLGPLEKVLERNSSKYKNLLGAR